MDCLKQRYVCPETSSIILETYSFMLNPSIGDNSNERPVPGVDMGDDE